MQAKTELEVSTGQAWSSVSCLVPFVLPCFISKSEQPFVHTQTIRCRCKAGRSHLFLISPKPQGKTPRRILCRTMGSCQPGSPRTAGAVAGPHWVAAEQEDQKAKSCWAELSLQPRAVLRHPGPPPAMVFCHVCTCAVLPPCRELPGQGTANCPTLQAQPLQGAGRCSDLRRYTLQWPLPAYLLCICSWKIPPRLDLGH